MATRKQVAARAGVSEATVSYVLNNTKPITPAVRARVLAAVQELHYQPNLVARSLASSRTRHVAILVDNLQNPYFLQMLEGAQHAAAKNGYIISTLTTAGADLASVAQLMGHGVEGAILTVRDGEAEDYMRRHVHCVLDRQAVQIDYAPAIYEMAADLAALGHRDIAMLAGIGLAGNARYTHLCDALAQHGLCLPATLVEEGARSHATDEAAGYEATRRLLARGAHFTALFAINDLMAIGALRALTEAGLSVPGDVSLAGCDNTPLAAWLTPSLSSMDVHAREMGAGLLAALIDKIEGQKTKQRVLPAKYIRRQSIAERKTP